MTWHYILQTLILQIQTQKNVTIWQIILAPWDQEMSIFAVLKCSVQNCFQIFPAKSTFFMSYFGLINITGAWFIIIIVTIVCKYLPARFFRDKIITGSDLPTWILKWHGPCSIATWNICKYVEVWLEVTQSTSSSNMRIIVTSSWWCYIHCDCCPLLLHYVWNVTLSQRCRKFSHVEFCKYSIFLYSIHPLICNYLWAG
jgi:hypothetical protein